MVSSAEFASFHSIIPQAQLLTDVPLCLAYTAYGGGHFEATCSVPTTEKPDSNAGSSKQVTKTFDKGCRCGVNAQKGEHKKVFCTTVRCPCFKESQLCKGHCSCHGCQNGKPDKQTKGVRSATFRKFGEKHAGKLNRDRASDFLAKRNIELKTRAWSLRENLLLQEIMSLDPVIKTKPKKFLEMYNYVASKNGTNYRMKTLLQMKRKIYMLSKLKPKRNKRH
jgi:hypothetical protein